ncbi:hypothetical protein BJ508DRAFT_17331 [Ascobolus immersus RN42]|uniref:Uncharacterized protein n=1 Tax=Ascobolus immersus RN42 TaxID=1160509 RepID=A0A3N4HQT9_ASCIM|nr:hypothetical protein BJ508DRAFT_17331 [Ascobolus immersus RN42]
MCAEKDVPQRLLLLIQAVYLAKPDDARNPLWANMKQFLLETPLVTSLAVRRKGLYPGRTELSNNLRFRRVSPPWLYTTLTAIYNYFDFDGRHYRSMDSFCRAEGLMMGLTLLEAFDEYDWTFDAAPRKVPDNIIELDCRGQIELTYGHKPGRPKLSSGTRVLESFRMEGGELKATPEALDMATRQLSKRFRLIAYVLRLGFSAPDAIGCCIGYCVAWSKERLGGPEVVGFDGPAFGGDSMLPMEFRPVIVRYLYGRRIGPAELMRCCVWDALGLTMVMGVYGREKE